MFSAIAVYRSYGAVRPRVRTSAPSAGRSTARYRLGLRETLPQVLGEMKRLHVHAQKAEPMKRMSLRSIQWAGPLGREPPSLCPNICWRRDQPVLLSQEAVVTTTRDKPLAAPLPPTPGDILVTVRDPPLPLPPLQPIGTRRLTSSCPVRRRCQQHHSP